MKIKLTFAGHFRMLSFLLLMTITIGLLYIYDPLQNKNVSYFLIPYFIIFVLPVLYIHFDYYSKNKGISFIIQENQITIQQSGETITYQRKEISGIKFIMTKKRMNNVSTAGFLFENYYYAELLIINGETLIITSLYHDVERILHTIYKGIDIQYENRFYPAIEN